MRFTKVTSLRSDVLFYSQQRAAKHAAFSVVTRSTWPHFHPPVACKRRCFQMWTTARRWGPTPCVPVGQRAAAEETWSTTPPCSASKSSLHSITAPATARHRRPRHPALQGHPWWTSVTMKVGCSHRAPRPSRKSMDIADYSGTLTCGHFGTSFRRVGWRGLGRSSITDTFRFKSQMCRLLKGPVLRPPTRLVVWDILEDGGMSKALEPGLLVLLEMRVRWRLLSDFTDEILKVKSRDRCRWLRCLITTLFIQMW